MDLLFVKFSEIPVHNFGLVFHKKLLARKTGCCIVISPMPLEFSAKKASRKIPAWSRRMPLRIFCKQSIAKKRGMGPYFN
jgi:hypothetical protein